MRKKTKTKSKNYSSQTQGFTLVELLVVISLIGILAAIALVSFVSPQKQARDTQRKSDLKQYQNSLEVFANKNNGLYPSRLESGGARAATSLCTDLGLSSCPEDPRYSENPNQVYLYLSDGSGSPEIDAQDYVLWTRLENSEEFFVVCSTGQVGTKEQSGWSEPTGGGCPL